MSASDPLRDKVNYCYNNVEVKLKFPLFVRNVTFRLKAYVKFIHIHAVSEKSCLKGWRAKSSMKFEWFADWREMLVVIMTTGTYGPTPQTKPIDSWFIKFLLFNLFHYVIYFIFISLSFEDTFLNFISLYEPAMCCAFSVFTSVSSGIGLKIYHEMLKGNSRVVLSFIILLKLTHQVNISSSKSFLIVVVLLLLLCLTPFRYCSPSA